MSKKFKWTLRQRRYMSMAKKAYKKILNFISSQKIHIKTTTKHYCTPSRMATLKKPRRAFF